MKVLTVLTLCMLFFTFGSSAQPASVTPRAPEGMVLFFDVPSGSGCPAGWKEAEYARGRLILGATLPVDVLKTGGTPLGNMEVPSHSHPKVISVNLPYRNSSSFKSIGSNHNLAAAGTYTYSGTTEVQSTQLPLIQYLACEAEGTAAGISDTYPFSSIAFFNAKGCPTDWTYAEKVNGSFLLSRNGEVHADVSPQHGTTWENGTPQGHTHGSSQAVIEHQQRKMTAGKLGSKELAQSSNLIVSGSAQANSETTVPFVTLYPCKKTQFTINSSGESGSTLFTLATSCPTGWSPVAPSAGRFVVGAPPGGTTQHGYGGQQMKLGDDGPSHSHRVSGAFTFPNMKSSLSPQWAGKYFQKTGPFSYNFNTAAGPATIPYVSALHCVAD